MKIYKNKIILIKEEEYQYHKKIKTTIDIVEFIRNVIKIQEEIDEVLYLLNLNSNNVINSFMEIARGGLNYCYADQSDIIKKVLINNCKKFILVHNHISGSSIASKNDLDFTKKMKESCDILDLQFLDHIIVCNNEYSSCLLDIKRDR